MLFSSFTVFWWKYFIFIISKCWQTKVMAVVCKSDRQVARNRSRKIRITEEQIANSAHVKHAENLSFIPWIRTERIALFSLSNVLLHNIVHMPGRACHVCAIGTVSHPIWYYPTAFRQLLAFNWNIIAFLSEKSNSAFVHLPPHGCASVCRNSNRLPCQFFLQNFSRKINRLRNPFR